MSSVTVTLSGCGPRTPVVWAAYVEVEDEMRGFSAFAPEIEIEPDASLTVEGPMREDVLQTTRVTGLPKGEIMSAQYRIRSGRGTLQEGTYHGGLPSADGTVELVDRLHDLGGRGLMGAASVFLSGPSGNTEYMARG